MSDSENDQLAKISILLERLLQDREKCADEKEGPTRVRIPVWNPELLDLTGNADAQAMTKAYKCRAALLGGRAVDAKDLPKLFEAAKAARERAANGRYWAKSRRDPPLAACA